MTYREFLNLTDEKVKNMSEREKTDWIRELARKQKEHQWDDFLPSFDDKTQKTLSENEQINKINDFLRKVEEGDIYFDSEEEEYYDDGCWERDFRTIYLDSAEIGKQLSQAFDLAEILLMNKQYKQAAELYERLTIISVDVVGDFGEYDPLDLNDMVCEELLYVNLKTIALNLLYSQYQCLADKNRAGRFVEYFKRKIFHGVRFDEVFTVGPEE